MVRDHHSTFFLACVGHLTPCDELPRCTTLDSFRCWSRCRPRTQRYHLHDACQVASLTCEGEFGQPEVSSLYCTLSVAFVTEPFP